MKNMVDSQRWRNLKKNQSSKLEQVTLPIEKVKPDPTNPNIMSDEKFKALKNGLKKQFSYPVIIDQHNTIIDGFHRWKAWKELGNKDIKCIIQPCKDDIERKIWRQVYNKVRGEHDRTKDKADFLEIFEAKKTDEFLKLLGSPKESFLQIIGKKKGDNTVVSNDANPTEGYMKSYLAGNVKQITILFTNDEFTEFWPRFQKIMKETKSENQTTCFMKLIKNYENCSCQKI